MCSPQVLRSDVRHVACLARLASDLSQALIKEFVITVSGRPSARLVPAQLTRWQRWADVADLFDGPDDPEWSCDRELLDDALRDPWALR